MGRKNSNESGQSIVIMAFAIIVLMGIMAVAIDGGRIYTQRRDAQNAADAAALNGARALCRDEDYEAAALEVAARGGYSGAGVIEVNNPPVRSDSPVINDDQVEVVITATIGSGFIAPIIYQGEINTRVLAVGDCLRGELSGSGAAIFAGGQCPGNEVDVNGSQVTIIGGVHSNGDVQVTGGGTGIIITGTVSHNTGTNVPNQNTTVYPPDGNPTQTTPQNYPIDLEYAHFVPGTEPYAENNEDGWAYTAVMAFNPAHYHYFPESNGFVNMGDLQPYMNGNDLEEGVYVTPVGFKFSGGSANNMLGDDVTFVTRGEIDYSGNGTHLRPYFAGLLMLTDGFVNGGQCDNNPVIKLSGSNFSWGGIIFAPNGGVNMSAASNGTFYGSIIAGQVDLSGSNIQIIYDPSYLPPTPDTIELGQ